MTIERSAIQRFGARFAVTPFRLRSGKTLAKLAGLAVLLAPIPGCQSITGNPTLSQVRVIDASPDAPGIDVYQGSAPLAYNLGLGSITSYVPISPGQYAIAADTAGTRQTLVSATGTFLRNQQYTVLVGNFAATLQELILKDQNEPAPAGQFSVRFIDQSTRAGAMDIYLVPAGSTLANAKAVLTDITFNTNSGYYNIPNGTYSLVAVPTGTVPSTTTATSTLYSGAAVTYPGGSARTIVLIDTSVTTVPGIQVVTGNDYDSAGESS